MMQSIAWNFSFFFAYILSPYIYKMSNFVATKDINNQNTNIDIYR